MPIRHQSLKIWMLAASLIMALFISACDHDNSSSSAGVQTEFVTAAAGDGMYALNAETDENAGGGEDVQREIEEADIIKIEGTRLYILNQYRGLFVCDISDPDSPSIMGRLAISGEPLDMYIRDGRAYVIVSLPQYLYYGLMETRAVLDNGIPEQGSRVIIADVSNSANPSVAGTVTLEGRVADSRIVGNILYVVSSRNTYYGWDVVAAEGGSDMTASVKRAAACREEGGQEEPMLISALDETGEAVEPVLISNAGNETFVAAIDVSDPANAAEVDRETLSGTSQYIHVTDSAIFIPSTEGYYYGGQTTITYVDISDPAGLIAKRGDISIPGSIQDKFKMDYADGYFRVCSYEWDENGGKSSLRVIDVNDPDNMVLTGSVELGQGEQLFATRFDGNRAYMVTFEQVDPLWVIDLSDPQNPQIKGELTVPGWSTHIEPRGDRLIALGVNNENGWQVSVSLFDVTDPAAPSLVDRVSFGDANGWSSSTAYSDVKALTIIDDMGLILLPYSTSSYDGSTYTYQDNLQLIDYSAAGLDARGQVAQEGSVLRSRSFEDRLFSISGRQLQVIDASNRDRPMVTASLGLMENIIDFEPLSSRYGVRVVQDDAGLSTLQAVPMQDPEYGTVAGEIALEPGESFTGLFASGSLVYVISNYWDYPEDGEDLLGGVYLYYEGTTRVTVYDFADADSPVRRGRVELDGSYALTAQPDIYGLIYPYYYSQGEYHRLGQDALVFVKPPQNDHPILYADAEGGAVRGSAKKMPLLLGKALSKERDDDGTGEGEEPLLISTLDEVGAVGDPVLISPYDATGEGDEPVLISPYDEPGTEEEPVLISAPEETKVTVVDLSDADAPAVASETMLPYGQAAGFFVNNSTLCFSYFEEMEETDEQGRAQRHYYLGRLDLTDISAPVEQTVINIPGLCLGLNAAGDNGCTLNMEWTGTEEARLFTFNTISLDGDSVALRDTVELGSSEYGWYWWGYDYLLTDSRVYFTGFASSGGEDESVLKVLDISNPDDVESYDQVVGANGWVSLMDASGTTVFIGVSDSVACYDTSSPDELILDDYRCPGGWGNRIVFSGGKAYVPMGYYGLWVKDI